MLGVCTYDKMNMNEILSYLMRTIVSCHSYHDKQMISNINGMQTLVVLVLAESFPDSVIVLTLDSRVAGRCRVRPYSNYIRRRVVEDSLVVAAEKSAGAAQPPDERALRGAPN